jgi:hypothetical protein
MPSCLTNIAIVHHVWTVTKSYDSVHGGDGWVALNNWVHKLLSIRLCSVINFENSRILNSNSLGLVSLLLKRMKLRLKFRPYFFSAPAGQPSSDARRLCIYFAPAAPPPPHAAFNREPSTPPSRSRVWTLALPALGSCLPSLRSQAHPTSRALSPPPVANQTHPTSSPKSAAAPCALPPVCRRRHVDPTPSPQSAAAAPCTPFLSTIGAATIDVRPPRRCGPRRSRRPCPRSTGAPSPAPTAPTSPTTCTIRSSAPATRAVRSTWCGPLLFPIFTTDLQTCVFHVPCFPRSGWNQPWLHWLQAFECESALEWMYDGELSISDKVKEQVRSPIAILQLHVICWLTSQPFSCYQILLSLSFAWTKNMDWYQLCERKTWNDKR